MGWRAGCARRAGVFATIATVAAVVWLAPAAANAQQLDDAEAARRLDAAIRARFDAVASYTATEHYTVFRGENQTTPAAEMTVRTNYGRETGKRYTILSESGSGIIRRFGLEPLLENEKRVNDPANRDAFWFTSSNYDIKLKTGALEIKDGVDCLALAIEPKHKAPNLISGTLWVDTRDFQIVRIEGMGTKSTSIWTGPPRVMRQYARFSGFSQATHARAETDSALFGKIIVYIDYTDYRIELVAEH